MQTMLTYGLCLITFAIATLEMAAGQPRKEITIDLGQGVKMTFVRIEPGDFLMGAPANDPCAYSDEKPQRHVKITQAFYLGKYEVTRAQFKLFAASIRFVTDAEKGNCAYNWRKPGFAVADEHPVSEVSWIDAKAFCAWVQKERVSEALGIKEVRLPTEAEWEYACRGGTESRFYSGDHRDDLKGIANVADIAYKRAYTFTAGSFVPWDDGYDFTAPVGKFKPNLFGLYDMIGNVGEWCEDYYGPYKDLPVQDPVRSAKYDGPFGSYRVWRGGHYLCYLDNLRASARFQLNPDGSQGSLGFRVLVRLER